MNAEPRMGSFAMLKQIVKDYQIVADIPEGTYRFGGSSCAVKTIVLNLFDISEGAVLRTVLDIGFGMGELGGLIKKNPATSHWNVDGIDGFDIACRNLDLFQKKCYRNVWHGLAQDLRLEQLQSYDVICLFDVIEHLNEKGAKELLKKLLSSLGENSLLVISTPLWFYPQASQQDGDLEEHLIGVPATAMAALRPLMYCMGYALVGNFVFNRDSLKYIDEFKPTTDRSFSLERGTELALQCGMRLDRNILFKIAY